MTDRAPSTELASLRNRVAAVQRLSSAASGGMEGLTRQLAHELGPGGRVLLVDRLNAVVRAHPREAAAQVTALTEPLTELWRRGTAGSLVSRIGDDTVLLQTVGENEADVILVAAMPADAGADAVAVTNAAASLAVIHINAARRLHEAEERLHNAVLQLLLDEEVDKASRTMPGGLPAEPVRVYRVSAPGPVRGALRHHLWRLASRFHEPAIVTRVDDEIVLCVRDDAATGRLLRDRISEMRDQNVRVGKSDPMPLEEFRAAYEEADHALRAACAIGTTLMSFGELAEERLLRLIPHGELLVWAATLLRPVTDADDAEQSLLRTLRAWLECHGRISQTSAALGMAPQTIRRRIVRVAGLLQGDLDDECVRVRLYLALQIIDRAGRTDHPYGDPLDVGKDCLVWLLDIRESVSWAASVMKPLRDADPDGRLRQTVRTWLALHGELSETAAQLGIHRNTLSKRLARAEAILDFPLSWIGNRAQLYLALLTDDLAAKDSFPPEAYAHTF
ncbi:helix-turn-helix domain-containing protein [Spirillospora sp. CA-142024]|uniref:helix-turn-helix domain-containing protein n=1 Tax=Spirillospora sp. CA-142024 TaxID=3240036 RepID=UPI003D938C67